MKEESELKTATQLIFDERERQISREGWTLDHDDQHINGELSKAAKCYYYYAEDNDYTDTKIPFDWPWEPEWWKPKNQLQDYIRAGALYLAELRRLERTGGAVGPKLTNIRIGIRQCEIRIDEILSHETYCAKKHRPKPVVQAKTAEEILAQFNEGGQNRYWKGTVLEAMHAYHAQFTPSAKSVEVEEAVREAAKAEMGVSYEPHMSQMDQSFIEGAEFGSNWQQQKQAEAISRMQARIDELEYTMKEILIGLEQQINDEWVLNSIDLAKEALKEKE